MDEDYADSHTSYEWHHDDDEEVLRSSMPTLFHLLDVSAEDAQAQGKINVSVEDAQAHGQISEPSAPDSRPMTPASRPATPGSGAGGMVPHSRPTTSAGAGQPPPQGSNSVIQALSPPHSPRKGEGLPAGQGGGGREPVSVEASGKPGGPSLVEEAKPPEFEYGYHCSRASRLVRQVPELAKEGSYAPTEHLTEPPSWIVREAIVGVARMKATLVVTPQEKRCLAAGISNAMIDAHQKDIAARKVAHLEALKEEYGGRRSSDNGPPAERRSLVDKETWDRGRGSNEPDPTRSIDGDVQVRTGTPLIHSEGFQMDPETGQPVAVNEQVGDRDKAASNDYDEPFSDYGGVAAGPIFMVPLRKPVGGFKTLLEEREFEAASMMVPQIAFVPTEDFDALDFAVETLLEKREFEAASMMVPQIAFVPTEDFDALDFAVRPGQIHPTIPDLAAAYESARKPLPVYKGAPYRTLQRIEFMMRDPNEEPYDPEAEAEEAAEAAAEAEEQEGEMNDGLFFKKMLDSSDEEEEDGDEQKDDKVTSDGRDLSASAMARRMTEGEREDMDEGEDATAEVAPEEGTAWGVTDIEEYEGPPPPPPPPPDYLGSELLLQEDGSESEQGSKGGRLPPVEDPYAGLTPKMAKLRRTEDLLRACLAPRPPHYGAGCGKDGVLRVEQPAWGDASAGSPTNVRDRLLLLEHEYMYTRVCGRETLPVSYIESNRKNEDIRQSMDAIIEREELLEANRQQQEQEEEESRQWAEEKED
eukprot:gene21961-29012_t